MSDQPVAASRIFHEFDFDKPGKQAGYLRVPQSRDGGAWATIEIPFAIVNGGNGPSVLLSAGVHGDEYEGQIVMSRLARTLDPQAFRGRAFIMPAVDLPAALAGRRMCPIDGRDFNRCLPGDPKGSFCQILAHFIDSVIFPRIEVMVDIHSAGNAMEAALSTNMHYTEDPAVLARTFELTSAFGAPYNVVFWGVDETATMQAAAERQKIIAVGAELGGYGRVSVEGVRITERGVKNVLKALKMIEGTPETAQRDGSPGTRHMQVRDQKGYVFAPSDGLYEPLHLPGDEVQAGEVAGFLHFVEEWAREPVPLHYRSSGYVWMAPGQGRVRKGDAVGVVMQPYG